MLNILIRKSATTQYIFTVTRMDLLVILPSVKLDGIERFIPFQLGLSI